MPKHTFSATLKAKNYTVKTKLDLLSFIEDGINIVYAPALDIYGYGESERQAQESFGVCFEEYIRYTMNKHTFEADLNSKGWKISSKGKNISLTSPDIFSYIHNNEQLKDIWQNREFRKYNQEYSIPIS